MSISNRNVQVIDLFAGAGGFGIAAEQTGARLKASVEIDKWCCETLRSNLTQTAGHQVIEGDLCDFSAEKVLRTAKVRDNQPLIVVGGAPCQPFSKAAYWTDPGDDAKYRRNRANGVLDGTRPAPITIPKDDDRRSLVGEFYRFVRDSKADGFVFENVPSILHPRNRPTLESFVAAFRDDGYKVSVCKAMATEYGVPQARERVFVLGSRGNLPSVPVPSHLRTVEKSIHLKSAVTSGEVLQQFQSDEYAEPEEVIVGKWADHLLEVPPGKNYKALTAWAGHPNPSFVAETRFWNFLLKLSPEAPSWTLAASPGPWTGPFHWDNRRLRTAEMAALQTFPDGYKFAGSRRERVRQIGNAVPIQLARPMISAVIDAITDQRTTEVSEELRMAV